MTSLNNDILKQIEVFVEKNSTEREGIHTRQIRPIAQELAEKEGDRKSTRLNSSHIPLSRMPSSA